MIYNTCKSDIFNVETIPTRYERNTHRRIARCKWRRYLRKDAV